MPLSVFLNFFSHRVVRQRTPISHIYHRAAGPIDNLVITTKLLHRLRKIYANTMPNHQRRIRHRIGQLPKRYVIHSMNEFLDLFFHDSISKPKTQIVKKTDKHGLNYG